MYQFFNKKFTFFKDYYMAEQFNFKELICVGFLNLVLTNMDGLISVQNELHVEKYLEKFDIVITNDGNLLLPQVMVNLVMDNPQENQLIEHLK